MLNPPASKNFKPASAQAADSVLLSFPAVPSHVLRRDLHHESRFPFGRLPPQLPEVQIEPLTPAKRKRLFNRAAQIQRRHSVHPLLARVLAARGWKAGHELSRFLKPSLTDIPDKRGLKNLDRACSLILRAACNRQKIAVCCDYDADGACSAVQLCLLLQALKADYILIPSDRYQGGYGLKKQHVEAARQQGCKLLLAADIGTNDHEAVTHALLNGLAIVIIDHHKVEAAKNPPSEAVLINPSQRDCRYAAGALCSAGLTWVLAGALKEKLCRSASQLQRKLGRRIDLQQLLQFAALGTVADMAPLTGANRVIVKLGIKLMNSKGRPGIEALKKVSGIKRAITSSLIAFQMAPRLNAAGRLAKDQELPGIMLAINQLLAENQQKAEEWANRLQALNLERKRLEKETWRACLRQIRRAWRAGRGELPPVLVLCGRHFHPGVLGICAARIAEAFNRPTVLLAGPNKRGVLSGSARSTPDLPLYDCLTQVAKHFIGFGGHDYAAGCSIYQDNLPALKKDLGVVIAEKRGKHPPAPTRQAEVEMTLKELSAGGMALVKSLERLEPTGHGNPAVTVLLRNVRVFALSAIGPHKQHLRVFLGDQAGTSLLQARLWHRTGHPLLKPGALLNLVVKPTVHQRSPFNPKHRRLSLQILAVSPC